MGYIDAASLITVFINGVLTEVPGGRIDMRKMFGNDMILVHSSGEIVPSTEYGVLLQGLQIGESYFLVLIPSIIFQFLISYMSLLYINDSINFNL